MKWIVCLMLIVLGASVGVTVALNMTERVMLLKNIAKFIKIMGEKIEFEPKNLDEMVSKIKQNREFADCKFINRLDPNIIKENGFSQAWEKALRDNTDYLKTADRELLFSFGDSLGKNDFKTQLKHCKYYAEKLENIIFKAEDEAKSKGKLSVSLGTLAGIFAVIMFI